MHFNAFLNKKSASATSSIVTICLASAYKVERLDDDGERAERVVGCVGAGAVAAWVLALFDKRNVPGGRGECARPRDGALLALLNLDHLDGGASGRP